jgi:hypothetical protein
MINQVLPVNSKGQSLYRGILIYRKEYGYSLLTLIVDLYTHDEQSCVTSSLGAIDLAEECNCLPSCLPLAAVDVYHFTVTEGTEITVTITGKAEEYQARYTVLSNGIEEHPSSPRLHVIHVCESKRTAFIQR